MGCEFQWAKDWLEGPSEPEEWAVVELMGHKVLGGKISEQARFGQQLLRIDTPGQGDQWITQFYGGSAIYCVTPCTEAVARSVAARQDKPTWAYGLPKIEARRIAPPVLSAPPAPPPDHYDDPDGNQYFPPDNPHEHEYYE